MKNGSDKKNGSRIMQECLISDLTAATLATISIAILTFFLFWIQFFQHRHERRTSSANYKVALFDKRLNVFDNIEEYFSSFMREGRPSIEEVMKLRAKVRNANFLFPPEPLKFVQEVVNKSFEYQKFYLVREPLRERAWNKEELSEEEVARKDAALERMHAIQNWFLEQIQSERLRKEFSPYISLPQSL